MDEEIGFIVAKYEYEKLLHSQLQMCEFRMAS